MSYNLFLDDVRMPYIVGEYTIPWKLKALYREERWDIVRSYPQFVAFIESNGIPSVVSFDHDLADEHYRPSMFNPDGHYSNYYENGIFEEKTGYDCAKWLIEYVRKNELEMPRILCHSMNPIGKENIMRLFENYKNKM